MVALLCALALVAAALAGCSTKAPAILSLSPSSGAVGATVTVSGTDFGATQGSSSLRFGNSAVPAKTWSDTKLTVIVPSSMKTGKYAVTVKTGGGVSNSFQFEVTAAPKPTPTPSPTPNPAKTQKQVIQDFAAATGLYSTDATVKQAQNDSIKLYKASTTDPNWELWSMSAGQGALNYYFLMHKQNGQWVCANGGSWSGQTPQQFGAPADLTLPTPIPQ